MVRIRWASVSLRVWIWCDSAVICLLLCVLYWQWAKTSIFPEGFEGGLDSQWGLVVAAQEVLHRDRQAVMVIVAEKNDNTPHIQLASLSKVTLFCGNFA